MGIDWQRLTHTVADGSLLRHSYEPSRATFSVGIGELADSKVVQTHKERPELGFSVDRLTGNPILSRQRRGQRQPATNLCKGTLASWENGAVIACA